MRKIVKISESQLRRVIREMAGASTGDDNKWQRGMSAEESYNSAKAMQAALDRLGASGLVKTKTPPSAGWAGLGAAGAALCSDIESGRLNLPGGDLDRADESGELDEWTKTIYDYMHDNLKIPGDVAIKAAELAHQSMWGSAPDDFWTEGWAYACDGCRKMFPEEELEDEEGSGYGPTLCPKCMADSAKDEEGLYTTAARDGGMAYIDVSALNPAQMSTFEDALDALGGMTISRSARGEDGSHWSVGVNRGRLVAEPTGVAGDPMVWNPRKKMWA